MGSWHSLAWMDSEDSRCSGRNLASTIVLNLASPGVSQVFGQTTGTYDTGHSRDLRWPEILKDMERDSCQE